MAKQVFELKKQRRQLEGRFVSVNCATLRGDAVHSTLFGHKKGSFTGATSDRPGLLREANEGLLFLDEIGELGTEEQAMLLNAVETGQFLPFGSDREASSNFQLIAGTNRDLWQIVGQGTFREDLIARLDVWTYHLPSLRERLEHLEPNLDFNLGKARERLGHMVRFNREARERYLRFARVQLQAVVDVCRSSRSMAEAGRTLFQASRSKKTTSNDSHRLKQYFARYGLTFEGIEAAARV